MSSQAKASKAQSSQPKDSPQLLGKGTYGKVFLTKEGYAVKKTENGGYDFLASPAELDTTLCLQGSPYVITVKHCQWNSFADRDAKTQDDVFLVMELGKSVYSWIRSHYNDYSQERYLEAKRIILDMFYGLLQLKQAGIIHRDIKPANLLLVGERTKLIDFGFATFVTPHKECSGVSAIDYRAPECFACQYYDTAIDMWSAGLTAYEILVGVSIYNIDANKSRDHHIESLIQGCIDDQAESTIQEFFLGDQADKFNPSDHKLRDEIRTYYPTDVMNQEELDHFMNLLISCLRFNPKLRITPEQVIDHPWFLDQRPDQIELIDARRNELPYEVNKQILQLRKTVLTPFIKKINTWLARKVVDVPYDLRDLTHAIRMFDRSLISLLNKPISSQLAQDLLHLSIYTAFKYFHPLDRSYEFRHLYRSPTPYKKLVVIQRQLIVDYLDNVIFSPTIYEAAHTPEREFDRVAFTRGITLILKGTTQGKLPSQLIQV